MTYVFEFKCGTCGAMERRDQVGATPIVPRCDTCGSFMRIVADKKEER
jgi:uncharacterized Zn finger protein